MSQEKLRFKPQERSENSSLKVEKYIFMCVISALLIVILACTLMINFEINVNNLLVNVGETYVPEVKAELFGNDVTRFVSVKDNVDVNNIGEYYVKCRFLFKEESFRVIVTDNEDPEINLIGPDTIMVTKFDEYEEYGAIATDNYDGNITKNIEIIKNPVSSSYYEIKYRVSDSFGNKAEKIRSVLIS